MKVSYIPYILKFKFDAGTSRGVLKEKKTWFIKVQDEDGLIGVGECGPLVGLSIDNLVYFEKYLSKLCKLLSDVEVPATTQECLAVSQQIVSVDFPSIRFGLETALLDLKNGGQRKVFDNDFVRGNRGISINGLVWMGDKEFMIEQIDRKIREGYGCIKIKIGAIDFDKECAVLNYIRERYSDKELSLRVDANGAFSLVEAKEKLQILSSFNIHSIEQPIKPGQLRSMAELVALNLLPIALDEELIGVHSRESKQFLLDEIMPPYIILKPTLIGGISSCIEWISLAEERGIEWWITSALESNIGLNAIAQFTANYNTSIPQGLGTGQLYHNNIASPLQIVNGYLHFKTRKVFAKVPGL
jgi:o-succinylbenzoate synthase